MFKIGQLMRLNVFTLSASCVQRNNRCRESKWNVVGYFL